MVPSEREESAKCLVCGELAVDGLVIRGERICRRCERALCAADPADPRYRYYARLLTRLWDGLQLAPSEKKGGSRFKV